MRTLLLTSAFLLALAAAPDAHAQGGFGIGAQIGDPTGLALKIGQGAGSFDFAAGTDFDERLDLQGHYLIADRRLATQGAVVRGFFGPGAFVATRPDRNTRAGLSFNFGLGFYPAREFEIFGQVTPQLQLTDQTDVGVGAALGLRFYP
ncbi:MAG: hypothetical protein ACK41D_08020 [Rubricoccaceae bacterium]